MRLALARRSASMTMNSSIKLWFVGGEVDWTTNTSSPRTFSSIFTNVSPSGNGLMVDLPSSIPMDLVMDSANGRFELPLKIFTTSKYFPLKQKPTLEVEKRQGGLY